MSVPAHVSFEIDLTEQEYEILKKFRMADDAQRAHAIVALTTELTFGSVEKLIADAEALRRELSPDALKLVTDWRNLGPELMYHREFDEGDRSFDGE
jgi:hypothetical protein